MNILILTKYPYRGPSSRYRFLQYLPYLTAAGHQYKVLPFFTDAYLGKIFDGNRLNPLYVPGRFLARLGHCLAARRYDLVWIEGEVLPFIPAQLERLLHRLLPKRRVYEFDDAVWLRYQDKALLQHKFSQILCSASGVVVGNRYLADYVSRVNTKLSIVPTTIDWDRYAPAEPALTNHTVGWMGSSQTVFFLDPVLPALKTLATEFPITLKVVGADLQVPGLNVETAAWAADTEIALLSSFDVGIMPLDDSPWARGKCGLKLIQYLAAGLPAVASPVGVNTEIIQDASAGYTAATSDEWVAALRKLFADETLRKTMGANGRRWARDHASLQVWAPRLIEFLEQCAACR